MYGLCKKLLWYKWTSGQLNTFLPDQHWSGQKVRKKAFNWSEVHTLRSSLSKLYVSGIQSKSSVFSTSKDFLFQGYVSHVCYEFCSTDRCNFFNSGFTTENPASSHGCRIPQNCNHFFNVFILMIIINKFV